ncbi:MAG: hypothetical protein J5926_03120 [Ruminococcus sp.]|nr:hypothetical protein [Ruminococcus sp.]
MTLSGSGDIIRLLSRTRAQPVSLLAQHGRVFGEDGKNITGKIQKKILKKGLTRSSESDIILKLLCGAEVTEKVF